MRYTNFFLAASVALSLVLGGCATTPAATPVPAGLAARVGASIDSIVAAAPLHRAAWGIHVEDAASGAILYSRNAEKLHIPASNMKLVVAVTALGRLGPEWRYRTAVWASRAEGGRTRRVVVRGSGDPTWSTRFYPHVAAPFDSIAGLVVRHGIGAVDTLVIDVSRFRDEPVHGTWEVSDLPGIFAPPVDAFAAGEGTFRLVLQGGPTAGSAGAARVAGPLDQPVAAVVVTDTAGARGSASVDFLARRDTIHLAGRVGAGGTDTVTLAVTRPAETAAAALLDALRRRGAAVGAVRLVRDTAAASALQADLVPVGALVSAPMAQVVSAILRPSQNWIAEQVLKTLGAELEGEGSWRGGNQVARRYLVDVVGVDSTSFLLRDASGMSAQNLLTPATVVALLSHARSQPWGPAWRDAMAQPGVAGTTLSGRLGTLEGRVFAKTGTITNVNSLSGHFLAADGREYLFSIMSNASGAPAALLRAAIDDIVLAMARHLDSR